jgi:hypothetical protein
MASSPLWLCDWDWDLFSGRALCAALYNLPVPLRGPGWLEKTPLWLARIRTHDSATMCVAIDLPLLTTNKVFL